MSKYLITSALPYINGVKHLGNIIGSMLPADVFARFLRQQGNEVLYICGTDDHGTPAEIAAMKSNQPVDIFCKLMHDKQKAIYKNFSISFDYFGRSSSPTNHTLTQEIFTALDRNGYIEEHEIRQVYSNTDKRFLPDRYVIGICPYCQYNKARGDQCEQCGHLLDACDLLQPYSAISGSKDIEIRRSKHIFLNLQALQKKVGAWVAAHPDWPAVTKGIANKWLSEGLQERCISRDLSWGIKIPRPGYEDKVFYVWFDAPIAYISITQDWAKASGDINAWKSWWDNSGDTNYYQFMAKDNLPFHTIFWPAIMIGAASQYKLADYIKGFNWLTYEGGKFSTSSNRGIFSDEALELFPADYWRYYLLSIAPESADSDFSIRHFADTVNKDLADVLGNFISRVQALIKKHFGGVIISGESNTETELLTKGCLQEIDAIQRSLNKCLFRQTIKHLRALWVLGNEYIAERKPWSLIKTDKDAARVVLANCLHLIRIFAVASSPVIPTTAERIYSMVCDGSPTETKLDDVVDFSCLKDGRHIVDIGNLIAKISNEQVEEISKHYAGCEVAT